MSTEPLALFAHLDVVAHVYWGIRIMAGLVAALIGWYACGPLTRLLYRLSFHRPVPGWLLPWGKLSGAASVGLLTYFFLPLGGGGGLGWGPGLGGGPGKGPGEGDGTNPVTIAQAKQEAPVRPRPKKAATVIEIEILGGMNYPGEGRYYLLNRIGPPRSLNDIQDLLRKSEDKIEVDIILTENSVPREHGAVVRLRGLLDADRIPTRLTEAPPAGKG
jgi:hypothetical protein